LNLDSAHFGDPGARALSASTLPNLRTLNLQWVPISDAGALALVNSPHLTRLSELTLDESRLSLSTREQLRQRFGP
jgi:hypothetical protein